MTRSQLQKKNICPRKVVVEPTEIQKTMRTLIAKIYIAELKWNGLAYSRIEVRLVKRNLRYITCMGGLHILYLLIYKMMVSAIDAKM